MNRHTVQSCLNQGLSDYQNHHKLPLYQLKAVSRLMVCRTAKLGGHSVYCENGHLNGVWYNSCQHRSCPQCSAFKSEQWLENTRRLLLDCPHHHWVFTLPHKLHDLWQYNRSFCHTLLFQSVNKTLRELCLDEKYLGAMPGIILAFHSWARNLVFHPHIHCLISHGGLNDEGEWKTPIRKSLLPAKVMMALFKGKYLAGLKTAIKNNTLSLPKGQSKQQALNLCNKWGRKDWVVHCVKPCHKGDGVANYLARYIRGGAVKNSQILYADNEHVRFRYKSHQTQKTEYLNLSMDNFMQRLLNHMALPRKQQYQFLGIYHSCCRDKLNQARAHLGQEEVGEKTDSDWQQYLSNLGKPAVCEQCGKRISRLVALDKEAQGQISKSEQLN